MTDQEGQQLLRITRQNTGSPIRLRQAMVVLASAGGNTVPAIALLAQADEDTILQVIHRYNTEPMERVRDGAVADMLMAASSSS